MAEDKNCVLCGDELQDMGNNPDPVSETGRACDTCNSTKVIPARLEQMQA